MTSEQIEKRRRVMQRSMALGHCICDPRQPCPCDLFKEQGFCHCAGEHPKPKSGPVKLTKHVRNAGCASKVPKGVLHEVLKGLPEIDDPRVLVGASAGDDAGVIVLGDGDVATILTVDVFAPSVDDPYTFGQIAAANSLSDIYAMGATPQVALSIIGFPVHALPAEAMREILRGGVEKMREAGICVIGGHSINDEEIKCGFAVVGTCPRQQVVRNAGARVGDVVILTKPLGTGITAFGHQVGRASDAAMRQIAESMAMLNKRAGEWMVRLGAHAATDVTGFSLIGHLAEIVKNSGVEVTLDFGAMPLFAGVKELAEGDVIPGACERNRESVEEGILELSGLSAGEQAVLFGPETSGGMLVFLPAEKAGEFVREVGGASAVIGRVTGAGEGGLIRAENGSAKGRCSTERSLAALGMTEGALGMTKVADRDEVSMAEESCCCGSAASEAAEVGAAAVPADEAFKAYMKAVMAPGALGAREKRLIALALSVAMRCEPCVAIHTKGAREAGASEGQVAEAAALGAAFGGAPSAMFYSKMKGR